MGDFPPGVGTINPLSVSAMILAWSPVFIVKTTGIRRNLTMAYGECLGNEMISDMRRFPEGVPPVFVHFSRFFPV